jgi:hypothetical protein
MNTKYRVNIIETERGWGQRVDDYKDFDSKEDVLKFVKQYNAANNLPEVPDWYMYAAEPHLVDLDDLDD